MCKVKFIFLSVHIDSRVVIFATGNKSLNARKRRTVRHVKSGYLSALQVGGEASSVCICACVRACVLWIIHTPHGHGIVFVVS